MYSVKISSTFTRGIFNLFYNRFSWLYSYRTHRIEELINHRFTWNNHRASENSLLISPERCTSFPSIISSPVLSELVFTSYVGDRSTVYTHTKHIHHSMAETLQHRVLRSQKVCQN